MNAFYHSMNVDGVVILLGGGDNTTLQLNLFELFALRIGGDSQTWFSLALTPLHPLHPSTLTLLAPSHLSRWGHSDMVGSRAQGQKGARMKGSKGGSA